MVDSWKFLDSRRMTNICERWSKDHTNALQYALFNGVGFESWENVWGTWNGITPRDGEQIRRVGSILRFLGKRRFLQSEYWVPHSPTTKPSSLFSSLWPAADGSNSSASWTIVNRDAKNSSTGPAINITMMPPAGVTWHYYDLYHGKELAAPNSGTLSIDLEVSGYGAVLATPNDTSADPELAVFLAKMRNMTAVPLMSLSNAWQYEQQRRVPIPPAPAPALPATSSKAATMSSPPAGMVKIPGGKFRFAVQGIEIEGGGNNINDNPYGVDFQYPWDPVPQRFHVQWMNLKPYFIDKHPVTQAQWAIYLNTGGGQVPADTWHYLWDWDWSGSLPKPRPGNESKPVVYVGLDEARAYCASLGKRLPREEEWQFAVSTISLLDNSYSAMANATWLCFYSVYGCVVSLCRVRGEISQRQSFHGVRSQTILLWHNSSRGTLFQCWTTWVSIRQQAIVCLELRICSEMCGSTLTSTRMRIRDHAV